MGRVETSAEPDTTSTVDAAREVARSTGPLEAPLTAAGLLSLQRSAGNAAVGRLLASKRVLARSPASDAISRRTTWYGDLDEDALGADLLAATLRGEYDFVSAVFDALGSTDRDDVAYGFMTAATDPQLDTISSGARGRRVLDRVFDELTSGSVDADEEHQADRLMRLRALRISPDQFRSAVQNAKVFPFRVPGMTVLSDAPIFAERRANGRIWVRMPVRVLGTDEFRGETQTLPTEVFLGGIELAEDEVVGVRMYDLGGPVLYRPALFLLQLNNQTDTAVVETIAQVVGLGLTLGAGAIGGLGIRAGMAARVLLAADRAALVLGTAATILHEHRGEILAAFPNNGPALVRSLEVVQSATAIYGFARVAIELPQLVSGLRRTYGAWQTERAAARALSSGEREAADALGSSVQGTLDSADTITGAKAPPSDPSIPPAADGGAPDLPRGFDADGRVTRAGNREVYNQGPNPTCGQVSCGMVINTSGNPVDLEGLVRNFPPQGTFADDLVSLLRRNRVVAEARTGMTVADVGASTRGGDPVIAMLRNTSRTRPQEALHWVVVDGVTTRLGQEVIAIRDPWGTQYFELRSVFERRFTGQAVVALYSY